MAAICKAPRKNYKRRSFDFLCTVPALIFFLLFTYYPIVELFRISLTDWNLSRSSYSYVWLKNYEWLFTGRGLKPFLSSLKITAIYTVGEVAVTLLGGMLLAMLFDRMTRWFGAMRVAVVMPKVHPRLLHGAGVHVALQRPVRRGQLRAVALWHQGGQLAGKPQLRRCCRSSSSADGGRSAMRC